MNSNEEISFDIKDDIHEGTDSAFPQMEPLTPSRDEETQEPYHGQETLIPVHGGQTMDHSDKEVVVKLIHTHGEPPLHVSGEHREPSAQPQVESSQLEKGKRDIE